jgi:hypothetical protein
VEELVHAVDPNRSTSVFHAHENVRTVVYHSQDHEYEALGWRVRAAIDNNFSSEAINSSKELLQKCIQFRFTQKQGGTA